MGKKRSGKDPNPQSFSVLHHHGERPRNCSDNLLAPRDGTNENIIHGIEPNTHTLQPARLPKERGKGAGATKDGPNREEGEAREKTKRGTSAIYVRLGGNVARIEST
jgi:hypothetical protein